MATASGGATDITDGQLNFSVLSSPAASVTGISLFEAGDFTLAGAGTSLTQAIAGASIRASVTQINGVDVAPLSLVPANASVGFNLAANPGVVQLWSLGLSINVAGQLGPDQRATRVEVVIDDQLLALSELASVAFIAKKDFRIDVAVPEPSTLLLLLGSGPALRALRRLH